MSRAMPGLAQEIADIRQELGRAVVGYQSTLDDLLLSIMARGHLLLEGVPGVAKTTLAKSFAAVLGVTFHRIQFTQDLLPADITGHYFFNQQSREFEMRRGAIFADLVLADEINRAPPKTQSALLEAMEERQVTIEGTTLPLPDDFMVVATMNPVDLEGVYRLPEAQLDRFLIRSRMSYLPPEDEKRMLLAKLGPAPTLRRVAGDDFVRRAQEATRTVHLDESVLDYLHAVCLATRGHPQLTLGASPRAVERLLLTARARALLDGRAFVVPDDVKDVAPRVLNHRIILSPEAELAGVTAERVVHEVVAATPLPSVDLPKG
jgi:MoxR-like ATPase